MRKSIVRRRLMVLSFFVVLVGVLGGALVATGSAKTVRAHAASATSFGPSSPTFVGPAATGCKTGCSLLSGPFIASLTASASTKGTASPTSSGPHAMPGPTAASLRAASPRGAATADAAPTPIIPTVRCQPLGAGCDSISTSTGGAIGVKGLNAVDSASLATNTIGRYRAGGSGVVRGQRRRRRDQQYRRDHGVQHGVEAPVRSDPSGHHHGAQQPGVEQRRRSVVRV